MMRSVLGVGIIGAGGIVNRHAIAYRSLPQLAKLVAVADIDEKRANRAKKEHGFQHAYTDYRALLDRRDIDVVSICTPPHTHTSIVLDGLEAGKHVLCEKPMSATLEEADLTIRNAQNYPQSKLSYVYQFRSDPVHRRIRQMILNGELGRILLSRVRVLAQRTQAYYATRPARGSWNIDGGGVLINQGIHQLDALVSFLGTPLEASAAMDTYLQPTEGEDPLVGGVRFENGAVAAVDCTVCAHEEWFAIDVLGENVQTTIRGGPKVQYCQWELQSKSLAVQRALWAKGIYSFPNVSRGPRRPVILAQKVFCKIRNRSWLPPRHWGHTPHVRDFLESIVFERPVPVSAREARRSLELAVGLYAAAFDGDVVRFPIGPDHKFYKGISVEAVARLYKNQPPTHSCALSRGA